MLRTQTRFLFIFIIVFVISLLFGQTLTFAQDPQTPTTTHVVQQGENLFRIALRYGFTTAELAQYNGISDPSTIYVGQVIRLPLPIGGGEEFPTLPAPVGNEVQPEAAAQAVEQPPAEPAQSAAQVTHIVQANEGLAGIARQYGVSWTAIAQANNLANPNLIYAGQTLIIPDPTAVPPADYGQPAAPDPSKWILIELSKQQITAYQDGVPLKTVSVSSGLPGTPTVTGDFTIYSKLPDQTMTGPGYYLPGVPWVMYFYRGYAIHGTYWHNNFGQPMSHGCVNLRTEDALWFYDFAPLGTLVRVVP